jgi:hypothetical protein
LEFVCKNARGNEYRARMSILPGNRWRSTALEAVKSRSLPKSTAAAEMPQSVTFFLFHYTLPELDLQSAKSLLKYSIHGSWYI